LPDGLFSNQKYQFGYIFESLRMQNIGIVYGHLEYFADNGDILWPLSTFCFHLMCFPRFGIFWYIGSRKLWQP
jgi:hypothetical protein